MSKKGSQTTQERKIRQVKAYYPKIKKTNQRSIIIAIIVLVLSLLILFVDGNKLIHSYQAGQSYIQGVIGLEEKEKAQEKKQIRLKSDETFQQGEQDLKEKIAGLTKEQPAKADYYNILVDGHKLQIDRNNIFVSDNANILSRQTKEKIYAANQELSQETQGAQLMVVTLKELPQDEDIELYANSIFNTLGIGNKDENNGVLFLLSAKGKQTRLEVGYGLESMLTDSRSQKILDNQQVVKSFRQKDYSTGVAKMIRLTLPYMQNFSEDEDESIKFYQDS